MEKKIYKNDIPDNLILQTDIAIDTETMGLKPLRDRLCLIQMSFGDGNCFMVQFDGNNYDAPNLKKLLMNQSTKKIFHFARFDLAVIKHYLGLELKNVFCTKIASKLSRTYSSSHSLRDLCREIVGINISKQQQTSNWALSELSEEQLEYAAKDVIYLHNIENELRSRLISLNRLEIAEEMFKFLATRVKLDLCGWEEEDLFAHS